MTTAVVGCAVIWGYDVARAHEVERDVAQSVAATRAAQLAAAQHAELPGPEAR
jgi:hypothetical protein